MHIFATVIRDDDVYGTISLQTALFLLVKPLLLALLEEHLLDEVVADILLVCLLLFVEHANIEVVLARLEPVLDLLLVPLILLLLQDVGKLRV